MENKNDEYEKRSLAFANVVKANGLQASLLAKFFRWNTDNQLKELIESVDGGVNRKIWEWDTQARSIQAWNRDNLRTQSVFIMAQFSTIHFKEWEETLEGDLSLLIKGNSSSINDEENLYSVTCEICTYNHHMPVDRYNWFGTVLKFWRGSLDTLRVNRMLAGKSGNTPMHIEVDRYLRALEKMHRATGIKNKFIKKDPRKSL